MIQQGNIRFFIPPDLIEPEALQQVRNTASMPFVHGLAVMPDVHYGIGSTVGTVVATEGAIMPACVGVDIGCGMIAVRTSLKPENIMPLRREIREGIERRIPVGVGSYGSNSLILTTAEPRIQHLQDLAGMWWDDPNHMNKRAGWEMQLGTLGGGNHFIEVCIGRRSDFCTCQSGAVHQMTGCSRPDGNDEVWIILHSGSRGVGNKTGNFWIKAAKVLREKEFSYNQFPDRNLSWLEHGTESCREYMYELHWCQEFALLNREEMMDRVLLELSHTLYGHGLDALDEKFVIERVNSHHNYVQTEVHDGRTLSITRKGAICADPGRRSLIPGSMGTNSYIVEGLGNPASYNSAPHGAGRAMSRTKAKASFTVDQVAAQMADRGIECRMREALIDEAPGAYKDIEETMRHAAELIRPLYQLRQVINVKGD